MAMKQRFGLDPSVISEAEPLEALRLRDGFYECPRAPTGERLGPLVGYAGKYDAGNNTKLQYVGDVYANFAKAEEQPFIYMNWATRLEDRLRIAELALDVMLGMPMGGIAPAFALALVMRTRFAYPEKKVSQAATDLLREQSSLAMIRHEIYAGERVAVVEDVTNNFSTTNDAFQLIHQAGATPVAVISWLNRSPVTSVKDEHTGLDVPVINLVHLPFDQYRQDDPAVAEDIRKKNVVLKPKHEWRKLTDAMSEQK